MTLSEVAAAARLTRSTTRRFLFTLSELGYVREDGRLYRLSPRVAELGGAYLASIRLPELALPHLRALADAIHESAAIAVLDGPETVCVAQFPARRIMSISIDVGARDPAYVTALGRVLLADQSDDFLDVVLDSATTRAIAGREGADSRLARADLAQVRREGHAVVDEDGMKSIAAPLRNADGRTVAGLTVAVHASRWTFEGMRRELGPPLEDTARAVERALATEPHQHRRIRRDQVCAPYRDGHDRRGDFIRALARGLGVIRAFDGTHSALTLTEVAELTDLTRATARRFLLTLVELGYVEHDGKLFRLRPRLLDLSRPFQRATEQASLTLSELSQPYLRAYVAETSESATVAVLDGAEIVYIAHVPAQRLFSITFELTTRDPASATSLGRVMLADQSDEWLDGYMASVKLEPSTPTTITTMPELRAELERVRQQGYSVVDQELEAGMRAVAVPIRDSRGDVVAAVNVAVDERRWSIDSILSSLLPPLLETAAAIERDVRATAYLSRPPSYQ